MQEVKPSLLRGGMNMMGGYGGCCGGWLGGAWGLGWVGFLLNVLIIIGLVALVVWGVRRIAGLALPGDESGLSFPDQRAPREILAARYASGEIDRDQYRSMLSDLG
jgi:uncharacterized membrane protein